MSGPLGSQQWMYASGFYPYAIDNSLRFNDDDSAYLSRTPASAGNRKTWTWSGWVKRGNLSTSQPFFEGGADGNNVTYIRFNSSNQLQFEHVDSGSGTDLVETTAVYRDVSSWYHIVFALDTTQATASDRLKIYVNGEQVTALDETNYPALNQDCDVNAAVAHRIGNNATGSQDLDAYLAEVNFIDGTALDASSFGETKSGIWVAKAYSGSYGTNGFHLKFDGNVNDSSGNGNNWTANNLSSHDYVPDSPTNNFCTLNPLFTNGGTTQNFKEGSLKFTADAGYALANGTFSMGVGKWYWEALIQSSNFDKIGITRGTNTADDSYAGYDPNGNVYGFSYSHNGNIYGATGIGTASGATITTGQTTYTTGDVIGCAFDADIGELKFYKNGTLIYTISSINKYDWMPAVSSYGGGINVANFGQDSTFAGNTTAGGNSDANGVGDFKYSVPSGYLALCSANLPAPAIDPAVDASPTDHFNTVLWTGGGAEADVTGVGFQPDMVWTKARSAAGGHGVWDVIRGATKTLRPDAIYAEATQSTALTAFIADGFTMGTNYNSSGVTYVGWNWKAGGTGTSNADGGLTSTVSVNQEAGISVVTWTDTGLNTIGHGLGAAPKFLVTKRLNGTSNWRVYHEALGNTKYMNLETTGAAATAGVWNNTSPTSSVFTWYGTSGDTMVAYCFAEIPSFSKMGSYTGNGSSDGPMVYTGFRPAWIMIKASSSAGYSWNLIDTARDSYNTQGLYLFANTAGAEGSGSYVDILSNGFKPRNLGAGVNGSGITYLYLAFAEQPFKYSNAR